MQIDLTSLTHIAALAAILGSLLYAIGDVLMLAPRAGGGGASVAPELFAGLGLPARRNQLLADMASLPGWRVAAGGLLGVFATPLTLAGALLLYLALRPAGAWAAIPPALLLACSAATAPFIHGSFIYVAYQASALAAAPEAAREPLGALLRRTLAVLFGSYAALFVAAILAWLWFVAAVLSGRSGLPAWMALANPLLITAGWLALRRVLPRRAADYTQGAGLNISNIVCLGLLSAALW